MTEYIYGTDEHNGHWITGEEIVRCRDCRRFPMCDLNPLGGDVNPDGFCAWGERRGLSFAEEMRGGDFVRGEIVRCRDCRWHWGTDELCMHPNGDGDYVRMYVEPDGFCAWGERSPRWRELENSDQYAAAAHAFDTTNHSVCSERGE